MKDFSSQQSNEREDIDGWTWVFRKKNKHSKNHPPIQEDLTTNRNKTKTFYFTNFPSRWDHVVMKEIFAKYGRVEDVFIAKKRNKQGKRFGFSRFKDVINPSAFERLLNTICIGTQQLRCNIARFQRRAYEGHGTNRQHNHTTHHRQVAPFAGGSNKGTYVDILKGTPNPSPTTLKQTLNIHLTIQRPPNQPVFSSIIAELKSISGATNTHNLFIDEGFDDFSIKYIGGLYLLIQLPNHGLASKGLSNPTFISHFMSLQPWNTNFRVTNRLTWIAISRLPPQLWISNPFSRIAEHWGKVMIEEDCSKRQFNRTTGKVCILTDKLDFIRETILVPVNKETISVRVFETDEDVDSLFNSYLFDSSSDEEEYFTYDSNDGNNEDHREVNNGNHHGDDDPHENDGDKKDPWHIDNDHHHRADEHEADDDHQHGNEEHGDNRDLGDFFGEESFVGINSNESRDFNTNMEKNFGYYFSALLAEVQIEEESTSVAVHGVNNIRTNKPTANKVDCDSKVTSTQPLICPTPPLSLFSHRIESNKNIHNSEAQKKRFASLRLIDPLNGVRGCVTQPKKNRHNYKNITHPVQDDVPSCGSENISDSLSKIERCNNRIKSNADHDTYSDSNEVSNTIHVGNQIGFKMNGKESDIEHILSNGDHIVYQ
ncbi:cytochrome P450 [Tanacetum coccineum]